MNTKQGLLLRPDIVIFAASLILVAVMFMVLASQLDIEDSRLAFDWKLSWARVENGKVESDLIFPPWTVVFLLPLGLFPLNVGWGLMMFMLLVVLILSTPPCTSGRWRMISIALLVTAYPVMRDYIDGNVEVITLGGVLLLLYSYRHHHSVLLALSVLLSTIKPQETYLLLLVIVLYAFQTIPRRSLLKTGAIVLAAVILAFIWKGKLWLESMLNGGWDYGISLRVVLSPVLPNSIILVLLLAIAGVSLYLAYRGNRQMSYPKAAMLAAASMLVSPYSQTFGMILILAIGVMPLLVEKPVIGLPLFVLYDIPFISVTGFIAEPGPEYWSILLFLSWLVLLVYVYRAECAPIAETAKLSAESV